MNILLTSVGRRAYIIEYLKEIYKRLSICGNIIAANSDGLTTAMSAADRAFVSPLIYDDRYIPFLLDICEREKVDILLSLFDIDLPILARHKKDFEKLGVRVIVSNERVINICNDKYEMLKYLKKLNLHIPETFLDLNEALKYADFNNKSYILKPRWGMGSLNIFEAENKEELQVLYNKAVRNLKRSYLKFESEANMDRAILIQEKITGDEYGLDILNDLECNYTFTTVKRKLAMRSGETDIAEVVKDEKLAVLGEEIGRRLGHIGNLDMDVLLKKDMPYIIDMNARFGGGYPFTHSAGVDELEAIIRWSMGENDINLEVKKYELFAKVINITALRI